MFTSCDPQSAASDWTNYTIVVPSVSVGNVGQLACDVLISSLSASKVGFLYDDSVLPVVGPDPFISAAKKSTGQITTALEVYESSENKVVIIQQRAPLIKGKRRQFVDRIVDWILSCRFKELLILTSVFAHERRDEQLIGPQTRFLATAELETRLGEPLTELPGWIRLESRFQQTDSDQLPSLEASIFMPGSGITKMLFFKCQAAGIPALVLLQFCNEGDNINEAVSLVSFANTYTKWISSATAAAQGKLWKIPPSWRLLFGCNFDKTLFA